MDPLDIRQPVHGRLFHHREKRPQVTLRQDKIMKIPFFKILLPFSADGGK
jgi:hypothetical protein